MRSQGVYTVLLTPFDFNNYVDWNSLRSLLDLQINASVTGVILCASTGEGHAFSKEELWQILSFSIDHIAGRIETLMGIPTNNTCQAVEWVSIAKKLGASGCLLATPYYNKPTQDGLVQHYTAVCQVGLPVMAYNVPSRTASQLLPPAFRQLSQIPNFVALKDSAGSVDGLSALIANQNSCKILCGNDSEILPWMSLGTTGVVSVCSNVLPEKIVSLYNLCIQNQWERAKNLHFQLFPLFQSLFCQSNPIPIKWTAFKKNIISSPNVRLPLIPLQVGHLQHTIWNNFLLGQTNS